MLRCRYEWIGQNGTFQRTTCRSCHPPCECCVVIVVRRRGQGGGRIQAMQGSDAFHGRRIGLGQSIESGFHRLGMRMGLFPAAGRLPSFQICALPRHLFVILNSKSCNDFKDSSPNSQTSQFVSCKPAVPLNIRHSRCRLAVAPMENGSRVFSSATFMIARVDKIKYTTM